MASQLAPLRTPRSVPSRPIRGDRPIPISPPIVAHFAADGRSRSAELGGNGAIGTIHAQASGDLLTLAQAERLGRALPFRWTDTACRGEHREDRRGLPIR